MIFNLVEVVQEFFFEIVLVGQLYNQVNEFYVEYFFFNIFCFLEICFRVNLLIGIGFIVKVALLVGYYIDQLFFIDAVNFFEIVVVIRDLFVFGFMDFFSGYGELWNWIIRIDEDSKISFLIYF